MNIVNVVVNDACLLIDLIDIDLFDAFLQLGFQAYITSSVFNEFEGDTYELPIRKSIENKALLLYKLTTDDQADIENLMRAHSSKLSEPDCSCLHLAQKINATGDTQWAPNGTIVCNQVENQIHPYICSDGVGGAIITWQDGRSGYDVYMQRINSSGSAEWATNGVWIGDTDNGMYPDIISDGFFQ